MNIKKDVALLMTEAKAKVPMRATTGSAGYDVFAPKEIHLPKGKTISMELPFTFEGKLDGDLQVRLFVRSSFGIKKKVRLIKDNQKNIPGIQLSLQENTHTVELLNDSGEDVVIAQEEHFSQFILSDKEPKAAKQKVEALTEAETEGVSITKGHMEVAEPDVYDYILDEAVTIGANAQITIATGYRSVIEAGTWTAITVHEDAVPFVMLANQIGVADADYAYNESTNGNMFIGLVNLQNESITLPKGTRLTQWRAETYYILEEEIKTDVIRTGGVGHTTK